MHMHTRTHTHTLEKPGYSFSFKVYCIPTLKNKTCFHPSGEILWDPVQLRRRTRRRENLQLPSGEVACRHEESGREEFPYILSGETYCFSPAEARTGHIWLVKSVCEVISGHFGQYSPFGCRKKVNLFSLWMAHGPWKRRMSSVSS